jgi:hypothetical protein
MSIYFPIYNLIKNSQHLSDTKSIDILYSKHNSIFDMCLEDIYRLSIKNIDTDQDINYFLDYHIYATNTLLEHIDKIKTIQEYHLIDCIFAHEPLSLSIKKEDKYLILEQLKRTPIVSTNNRTKSYFENSSHSILYHIPYGIPEHELNSGDRKPIVVVNLNNDDQTNRLFSYIKTHIPEAEIISSINQYSTISSILSKLNEYKVIIDTKLDINILCGLLSGCIAITANGISYGDSIEINKPEEIISIAKTSIQDYNINNRLAIIETLKKEHNYRLFTNNLIELIEQKIWRPYI